MAQASSISKDISRKIRQIEIYTKRLVRSALVGDSRSAIKGTGFEFDQIREYQMGDDVRFIDWNASVRSDKLLLKQYIEERSRVILLAVDVSKSSFFSSAHNQKHDVQAQIASALSLVADYGKDLVGLILFSDNIELYIPPRKGRAHVHAIMQALFGFKPTSEKTAIRSVLQRLAQLKKKNALVFLLSDFIDDDFDAYLPMVAKIYDLVAIRYLDKYEQCLPKVGFLTVEDIETGQSIVLDTRKGSEGQVATFLQKRIQEQDRLFKKYSIDLVTISNSRSYISDMIRFFRRRMRY